MTETNATGKLIDFSMESLSLSGKEDSDKTIARTQPTTTDTDARLIQDSMKPSSNRSVSFRAPTDHPNGADTIQDLRPGQICITRIPLFKYGNDMKRGHRIKIKLRVSDIEYLALSYEPRIHFIIRANDVTPTSEFDHHDPYDCSSHTSDYEEAYEEEQRQKQTFDHIDVQRDDNWIDLPAIEAPRADHEQAPPTEELAKPTAAPESTPKTTKPAIGTLAPPRNRRKNEIPVVTKADRRYLRRNSLAIYNRRIAKARSTLRHLTRNISNITEAMEESQNETIKPRQTIKPTPIKEDVFESKSNLSWHEIDTENSDSDEFDIENEEHIASGYAPPSTSHFLKANKKPMDKGTESALKHLRQHPEKVPKFKDYTLPLAFFLCRIIYRWAIQQGLVKVEFLDRWVFYAFPELNHEKVHHYLDRVRAKFPNASLFQTLRELAHHLTPDDFMTLQSI